MTNRAEYEATPVANALRTAKRALADALNAGAFEVQWAAAISDQAARAATGELALIRDAYEAVTLLQTSTLTVRPTTTDATRKQD